MNRSNQSTTAEPAPAKLTIKTPDFSLVMSLALAKRFAVWLGVSLSGGGGLLALLKWLLS